MKKTYKMCVTLTSIAYRAGKSCLVLAKLEKPIVLHCRNSSRDRTRRAGSTTTPSYPAKSHPFRSTGVLNSLSRYEVFYFLKVPSGRIGSAWEWYHWIGLGKDINGYRFFYHKYLSRFMQNEFNLLLVWVTVCMCSNRNPNLKKQHFGEFFHQSASANRKTGFYAPQAHSQRLRVPAEKQQPPHWAIQELGGTEEGSAHAWYRPAFLPWPR